MWLPQRTTFTRSASKLWMRVRNHIVDARDDQPSPRNNDAENNGADGDDGEGFHGNLHVAVSMQVTVSVGTVQSYRTEGRLSQVRRRSS
jgi:hypothetical protein